MKMFKCQSCDQTLFFENTRCEKCGHRLGYLPLTETLAALEALDEAWVPMGTSGERYRFCSNAALDACNWLIPASQSDDLCLACRHNRTIPDITQLENRQRW